MTTGRKGTPQDPVRQSTSKASFSATSAPTVEDQIGAQICYMPEHLERARKKRQQQLEAGKKEEEREKKAGIAMCLAALNEVPKMKTSGKVAMSLHTKCDVVQVHARQAGTSGSDDSLECGN